MGENRVKLKKINAVLGLVTALLMLVHILYSAYCYLTFYYNPDLKLLTALPFIVLCCLHAILGMAAVFTQSDGTRMDLYPKQNLATVLQRLSAALIFPLLLLHLNTFAWLKSAAAGGRWILFALTIAAQVLFYAVVILHVAVSLSRSLITLGCLASRERQKALNRVVYILALLLFLAAAFAVVKGQIGMIPMFLPEGGAA